MDLSEIQIDLTDYRQTNVAATSMRLAIELIQTGETTPRSEGNFQMAVEYASERGLLPGQIAVSEAYGRAKAPHAIDMGSHA